MPILPMNEALELLASAHQIAERNGKDTNWEAYKKCVAECLAAFNRRPVTARTFRIVHTEQKVENAE